MASQDSFHSENPQVNKWLRRDEQGKLRETTPAEREEATRNPPEAKQAAKVQALAADLGADPEELAKKIPADTLRRLKFPMIEQPQPDGTTLFEHDLGIREGVKPLLGIDRAHEAIPPGSAPQPRDSSGKFTK